MKTNSTSQSGFSNPRALLAFAVWSISVFLAALSVAANPTPPGWSLVNSPNATYNQLSSVACASASDCWAIGSSIFIHWNGTSWTTVATPAVNNAVLDSVACASTSECWTVGYFNNGSAYQTLIERWDGNSWFVVTSPNGTLSRGSQLNGVTCTSVSDCWAVGYNIGSAPTTQNQTLVERWNGISWTIVPSPNYTIRGGAVGTVLSAVACGSASDCWAIGDWNDGESGDAIFERWDGNSWSIFTTNPIGYSFSSVACASTSDCWAVTPVGDGNYGLPHSAHWDGTSWSIVNMPVPPDPKTQGYATYTVACASGSECWAVGSFDNGVTTRTLIEQWDGTSWSVVTTPNSGTSTQYNNLYGVACASLSQCWAVGYYNGGSSQQTLIEEFAPTVPASTAIGSRKIHGNAGTFDIDLLNASPGIECRVPGFTGSAGVDHKIVFTFVNNLTSCGTASTGSLSTGPGSNQCTVDLAGVANQQYVTVTLNNVLDSQANSGTIATTMGVLLGDVNASRRVDAADVSSVRQQTLQPVTSSNFRNDINASGRIDAADVSIARQQTLTSLP